jgi:8-oxo-dGTP pyrophosphatase MutT (NUDIX family)
MSERTGASTHQGSIAASRSFPNVRPRDAATLILIDRSGPTPKVLLGRRHDAHQFMPGKFVFPGGRVEPFDRAMPSATPLAPPVEKRLMLRTSRPSAAKARAFALAAIRETYEETGLMVGVRRGDAPAAPEGPWSAFAAAHVHPDLASMHFIARAVTPPRYSRRFDTRFFATDASLIAHRVDGIVGLDTELVELMWVGIAEAKHLDVPKITMIALGELEQRSAAGLPLDRPVPYYRMLHTGRTCQML